MKFSRYGIVSPALVILTACATRPVNAPAEQSDDPGYWETRLTAEELARYLRDNTDADALD